MSERAPRGLEMTALLLAGGFGTRLRDRHPGVPKPMIPVEGKPFLEWIIAYWRRQGVSRFVISLGHLAEAAQRHFRDRAAEPGLEIATIVEPEAMGTGGAIRHAAGRVPLGDPFLVANGDSLVAADCHAAFELGARPEIDGVLLGVRVPDTSRYGSLDCAPGGQLLGFREKQPGAGVINGGVYLLRQRLIGRFPPQTPLSIERDVFPHLLTEGVDLRVVPVTAPFLDIGTPESLEQAAAFVRRVML